MEKKAIILLSGGLDSTTTLAIARAENYALYAISFQYGQRHRVELAAAARVAAQFDVREHAIIETNLPRIGGSALTSNLAVPKDRAVASSLNDIPITYVPARNTIFLAFALGWAEVLEIEDIFIGVNALDYSGYPDCRPEYIMAFEQMANLATSAGVTGKLRFKIHTPLMNLSKAEIIARGLALGVDYGITHSCYDPSSAGLACGHCDSCQLRRQGFAGAGVADPLAYQQ